MTDPRPSAPTGPSSTPMQPLRAPQIHTPQPHAPQPHNHTQHPQQLQPAAPHAPIVHAPPAKPKNDEPIALIDGPPPINTVSKIKAFGIDAERRRENWTRKAHVGGTGICRVRSFHGKYSDQGIAHLDDQINEWLDQHPDIEVKHVTSTVNVFEGKIREPALVLNIWY